MAIEQCQVIIISENRGREREELMLAWGKEQSVWISHASRLCLALLFVLPCWSDTRLVFVCLTSQLIVLPVLPHNYHSQSSWFGCLLLFLFILFLLHNLLPVWVLRCLRSSDGLSKAFPQYSQGSIVLSLGFFTKSAVAVPVGAVALLFFESPVRGDEGSPSRLPAKRFLRRVKFSTAVFTASGE